MDQNLKCEFFSKSFIKSNVKKPENLIESVQVENVQLKTTKHIFDSKINFENEELEEMSSSESEEFKIKHRKNKIKKKQNKRILKKRLQNTFNDLKMFKNCTSKKKLQKILSGFSNKAKSFFKFYLSDCFIIHLFQRKLENKMTLLSKREMLMKIIENPKILSRGCNFDNNLLKNFCKGAANFIEIHFFDMEYQISRRPKIQEDQI